jgi:cell division septation protein DedD
MLERVHNALLDCALIVQAERDEEMPERVLVCASIRCLNLREAPEIDLVQMDNSRDARRAATPDEPAPAAAAFIDRDGQVHLPRTKSRPRVSSTGSGSEASANSSAAPSKPAVTASTTGHIKAADSALPATTAAKHKGAAVHGGSLEAVAKQLREAHHAADAVETSHASTVSTLTRFVGAFLKAGVLAALVAVAFFATVQYGKARHAAPEPT